MSIAFGFGQYRIMLFNYLIMRKNFWKFGINLFKNRNGLSKNLCSPTVSCNYRKTVTNPIEKYRENSNILEKIQKLLSCDIDSAKKIHEELPSIRDADHLHKIENNVKVLLSHEVSLNSIIDNPFVLIMPTGKRNQ